MPRFGLCGGSYTPKSLIADSQRLVNFYPEPIQSGLGRGGAALYLIGTPGLKSKYVLANGPARAQFTIPNLFPGQDRSFIISGGTLYELLTPPVVVSRGTIASDGYPAFIAANKTQLAIASAQRLYIFDLTTNTLSGPIVDSEGDLLTPFSVVYNNGFFVANCTVPGAAGTRILFSTVFDGTQWDPLDSFDAEASPDATLRLLAIHNEVWAFGTDSIQPFQTTGDPDNPFEPIQSGVIDFGIGAPASAVVLDNRPYWLGQEEDKGGMNYWTADGYTPIKVSNIAIDTEFASYTQKGLTLAYAFAYKDEGHSVIQLAFPDVSINKTWRYDKGLPPELAWYEVGCWNSRTGEFEAHHSLTHSFAFGMHLVGDRGGSCCAEPEAATNPVLIVTTCPLPDGVVGTPYLSSFIATGGTAPYTWFLLDGSLPDGLSLSLDGSVSGTPTTAQTKSFTVQVNDSDNNIATKTCQITINNIAPPGLDLVVPLEMSDTTVESVSSGSNLLSHTQRQWDLLADYDGSPTYFFEVVATNTDGVDRVINLETTGPTVVDTVTVPSGTTVPTRIRSAGFTPASGTLIYMVRIPQTTVNDHMVMRAARVIVKQSNATKTRIQIPLGSTSSASELDHGGNYWGGAAHAQSTFTPDDQGSLYKKEATKMADIQSWTFEVVGWCSATQGSEQEVALFNATSGLEVSGTRLSFVRSDGPTEPLTLSSVDFANSATNFTDGDEFQNRNRITQGNPLDPYNGNGEVWAANLYVRLANLSKAQIFARVGGLLGPVFDVTDATWRQRITTSEYNNTDFHPTFYFESTGWQDPLGNITTDLLKDADDSDTAGATSVTSIDFASTTKQRKRTTSLSLDADKRYIISYPRGAGGTTVIFLEDFQRSSYPKSTWGPAWANPDVGLGDWTIDFDAGISAGVGIITAEGTFGNHLGNRAQSGGGDLSIAGGVEFIVRGNFKTTTPTHFGAGGISIQGVASFGLEFGVAKDGGVNFLYTNATVLDRQAAVMDITDFTDKVLELHMQSDNLKVNIYVDGVYGGYFDSSGNPAPYFPAMFFINRGAPNRMVTWWKDFKVTTLATPSGETHDSNSFLIVEIA